MAGAPNTLERTPVSGVVVRAVAASSGQVAAAQCSVQLTGANTAEVIALTQMIVTSSGATAAATNSLQITGLATAQISGNKVTLMFGVPAGAGVPATPLALNFDPPLLGKPGTAIMAEIASLGSGHAGICINLLGKITKTTASN